VFVITLTVALVRFGSLAVITPGWGALAFATVVVLTMIASMQFDPRLIWDGTDDRVEPGGGDKADDVKGLAPGTMQQTQDPNHE
jgi:paraquat-inducible protein A